MNARTLDRDRELGPCPFRRLALGAIMLLTGLNAGCGLQLSLSIQPDGTTQGFFATPGSDLDLALQQQMIPGTGPGLPGQVDAPLVPRDPRTGLPEGAPTFPGQASTDGVDPDPQLPLGSSLAGTRASGAGNPAS